ncbi:MAG: PIN domain-containing protein [Planctomycetes bacterium]|nr:PIN domain-containing protein [Planctomycetota bacterium]
MKMASSALDEIDPGTTVFVDSTIFVYHFTGASADCRLFLARCESGDIKAVTSVVVLAEVAHRLMMAEALAGRHVSPGNMPAKLRRKPDVVRSLHIYQEQVERIPLLCIEVLPLTWPDLLASAALRERHGLLVNDSLIAATALKRGVRAIASADGDFERVVELSLFRPADIGSALQEPTR